MPLFYEEVNKKSWFYQPNLSRSRQRYRGTRESAKLNLEIQQFLYDVYRINSKSDALISTSVRYAAYISRGTTIEDIEFSGTNDNAIVGLTQMSSDVEDLRNRIIELERKYV